MFPDICPNTSENLRHAKTCTIHRDEAKRAMKPFFFSQKIFCLVCRDLAYTKGKHRTLSCPTRQTPVTTVLRETQLWRISERTGNRNHWFCHRWSRLSHARSPPSGRNPPWIWYHRLFSYCELVEREHFQDEIGRQSRCSKEGSEFGGLSRQKLLQVTTILSCHGTVKQLCNAANPFVPPLAAAVRP